MTALTLQTRAQNPFERMASDAPIYTSLGLFLTLTVPVTLAASWLDPRLFQGDGIWLKPVKFQIALAIYILSLAFFARFVPASTRTSRGLARYSWVVAVCILGEVLWTSGAAALGTGSHFNENTAVAGILYAMAGVFAVTLTSAALVTGVQVWRNPATGLRPALHLAIALGLVLTFVLTVPVAGYLSSSGGHFVGVPLPGAATVPIFGWSRTVGDLRVAHFLATHALHGLPLVGLAAMMLSDRAGVRVVAFAGVAYTALVAATFAQALLGLPLI